eukprot:5956039-Pleurochrysis_carterae.AAC.3
MLLLLHQGVPLSLDFSFFRRFPFALQTLSSRALCAPPLQDRGHSRLCVFAPQEEPDLFGFSVSTTTRAPRAGEVEGVAYYFVRRALVTMRACARLLPLLALSLTRNPPLLAPPLRLCMHARTRFVRRARTHPETQSYTSAHTCTHEGGRRDRRREEDASVEGRNR